MTKRFLREKESKKEERVCEDFCLGAWKREKFFILKIWLAVRCIGYFEKILKKDAKNI